MFDFHENSAGLATQMPRAHGPGKVLARFVQRVEEAAADAGVHFSFEHDFRGLLEANKYTRKTGATLTSNFNPECGFDGHDGWWVAGRDEAGELVATIAARVYDWRRTTLAAELESFRFLYPDVDAYKLPNEKCEVSASFATKISGRVFYGGGAWVRTDMRGKGLSAIMPRLSKAYGLARYNFDWAVAIVEPILVRKGVAKRYGFNNLEFGVHYTGTRFGDHDCALCWISRDEFIDDLVEVDQRPELLRA